MDTKKLILVIDDDLDILEFCQLTLGHAGYEVQLASTAAEGLRLITLNRPDLLILDVMIEQPDSGFQLATILGRDYPSLPIILFSSIAEASDQIFDTSTLPVKDMVNKPISPKLLLEKVNKILRK